MIDPNVVYLNCTNWYIFLVLKTSLSDKQMGFIRQNRSKNVDKREAEGSFLGVWVPKHIYSDTSIFLSCSTQWSRSFETKFVIFIHYGQFLQSLKHHCPPVWDHDNSKIVFLRLFVNKLHFDWSECGLFELYSSKTIFWC